MLALGETIPQTLAMLRRIVPFLMLVPQPAFAAPAPLTPEQQAQLKCVAVLAIVANEQQRGAEGWEDVPSLALRGARFSDRVGEAIVKASKQSREDVRRAVLAEVAGLQAEAQGSADPASVLRSRLGPCMAMLDALVPPPRPPSLVECAAALSLAYDDETAHNGMTKAARTMAIFASVLDGRAREELRAAGKSEAESDAVLGLEKEKLRAEFKAQQGEGKQEKVDYGACFEMARP